MLERQDHEIDISMTLFFFNNICQAIVKIGKNNQVTCWKWAIMINQNSSHRIQTTKQKKKLDQKYLTSFIVSSGSLRKTTGICLRMGKANTESQSFLFFKYYFTVTAACFWRFSNTVQTITISMVLCCQGKWALRKWSRRKVTLRATAVYR